MPPNGEGPTTGIARPSEKIRNSERHYSTPVKRDVPRRRPAARGADARPATSLGNCPSPSRPVAPAVADPDEKRGLEHISAALARIISETIVGASGGLFGELDADQRAGWSE